MRVRTLGPDSLAALKRWNYWYTFKMNLKRTSGTFLNTEIDDVFWLSTKNKARVSRLKLI